MKNYIEKEINFENKENILKTIKIVGNKNLDIFHNI